MDQNCAALCPCAPARTYMHMHARTRARALSHTGKLTWTCLKVWWQERMEARKMLRQIVSFIAFTLLLFIVNSHVRHRPIYLHRQRS